MGRGRTLAQVYRRFGEVDAAGKSPLYERIAVALSESGEALRAIEAATAPPLLLQGDAVEVLPGAIARVPADALPVVITTWALSQFPLESRLRFLHRLDEAAARRAVAWVSAEGVGVALAIPTLGDRRASGHSIIGLAVSGGPALRAEAIGRCWSQAAFWRGWQTLPAPLERLPASGLYSDKTNVFLRAC